MDFQHFVNGVKKENPRYLVEQFSQIEKFLENENPDRATVAVVMKICCEKWRYRFSQFKEIFAAVKNGETGDSGYVPDEVQKQNLSVYQKAFDERCAASGKEAVG